ncbi:hypothetical protein [uncultured Sphingomonas sp.]|uniref:hypothetical protein n=1 Tax=uncultured Sphingomonas sp. TaxID=158754 RepID=UPI0025D669BD|nr:hypothetical protein [uncultured Sphingomonas sp.]
MTDPFDRDLARLARNGLPHALDDLERRVAIAVAGPAEGGRPMRGMVVAGVVALGLGVAGGGVVAERIAARERPPVVIAALEMGLAPSTLLLGR